MKIHQKKVSSVIDTSTLGKAFIDKEHSSTYEHWQWAKQNRLINPSGNILLHFDTHSDMMIVPNEDFFDVVPVSTLENHSFINNGIIDGLFEAIFWIVPDNLPIFKPKPYYQNLYLEKQTPYSFPTFYSSPQIRDPLHEALALITICRLSELPSTLHRKPVIISIDADYYFNLGHDTLNNWKNKPDRMERQATLAKTIHTLRNRKIKAQLTTLALSPEYASSNVSQEIMNFLMPYFQNPTVSKAQTAINEYITESDPDRESFFLTAS